jgi:hypothetical protein
MQSKILIGAFATFVILAAEAKTAKNVEYECDQGGANSGYRIRVVDLTPETSEVIVLKKSNGMASLVEDRKLKRGVGYKKSGVDSEGNWIGTFTLRGKRGTETVRAHCGRVETLTL